MRRRGLAIAPLARGIWRWGWRLCLLLVGASIGMVVALRWVDLPTSAFMVRAQFSGVALTREWTPLERIAPAMTLAVVAAEDQRFPLHRGFDLHAISSAIDGYQQGRGLRGASTISQQTAKNLFLWSGRSFVRKGLEAWFTTLMEAAWPKRRILEFYLNVAEFGPGVYGVGAASRVYFDKPPAELTRAEAALLAAVLPNPSVLRVDRPGEYVLERRRWILRQMQQLGDAYLAGI